MNPEAGKLCPPHLKVWVPARITLGYHVDPQLQTDSDITVRRKAAFLLNTLLIQTDSELPEPSSNLRTPSSSPAPVHPNSHASMISDPSSTMTSKSAVEALENRGILRALVRALTTPVPYGEDGESEVDADFEEKVVL